MARAVNNQWITKDKPPLVCLWYRPAGMYALAIPRVEFDHEAKVIDVVSEVVCHLGGSWN